MVRPRLIAFTPRRTLQDATADLIAAGAVFGLFLLLFPGRAFVAAARIIPES